MLTTYVKKSQIKSYRKSEQKEQKKCKVIINNYKEKEIASSNLRKTLFRDMFDIFVSSLLLNLCIWKIWEDYSFQGILSNILLSRMILMLLEFSCSDSIMRVYIKRSTLSFICFLILRYGNMLSVSIFRSDLTLSCSDRFSQKVTIKIVKQQTVWQFPRSNLINLSFLRYSPSLLPLSLEARLR